LQRAERDLANKVNMHIFGSEIEANLAVYVLMTFADYSNCHFLCVRYTIYAHFKAKVGRKGSKA
jgi:hypothetical protein